MLGRWQPCTRIGWGSAYISPETVGPIAGGEEGAWRSLLICRPPGWTPGGVRWCSMKSVEYAPNWLLGRWAFRQWVCIYCRRPSRWLAGLREYTSIESRLEVTKGRSWVRASRTFWKPVAAARVSGRSYLEVRVPVHVAIGLG